MAHAISGELSFKNAVAALDAARDALAASQGSFEVDLGGVTRADSAGLALLLELARDAHAAGRELRCTRVPEQLRRLAGFFGVTEVLSLSD
ncbi:MAG: STAS domain-containing protein [Gammaproteobacteria bacterium]